jgi:hypothetical protein
LAQKHQACPPVAAFLVLAGETPRRVLAPADVNLNLEESMFRPAICLALLALTALATASPAAPAFPGQSGVIRFQDQVAFFIVDPTSGLMTFHGIDATFAQICAGGPVTFDDFSIQLVASPAGALHALFSAEEHSVYVYPAVALGHHAGPADCPILAGLTPLASGKARLIRTDNDLLGSGSAGANSTGWSAVGALNGPDGRAYQYSETVRVLLTPGQDFQTAEPIDLQTSIRLIPTGR